MLSSKEGVMSYKFMIPLLAAVILLSLSPASAKEVCNSGGCFDYKNIPPDKNKLTPMDTTDTSTLVKPKARIKAGTPNTVKGQKPSGR
jgi:hypothetical protein